MPGKTEPAINDEAKNAYRRDGVVHVPGAVNEDWLAVIAAGIEHNLRQPGPFFRDQTRDGDSGRYVFDYWTWQTIPEFGNFINNSPVKSLAAQVMDVSPVTLLMDNWFMNEAGATNTAPWHQDKPYFDYEGTMCNVLVTLDATPLDEALRFTKGSHKDDITYKAVHFRDHVPFDGQPDSQYADIPDIDDDGRFEVTGWALEPGDCLIFDLRTLHRGPNHGHPASAMRRRYSARFGAPDTIFSPRGEWTTEISRHLMQTGQKIDCVVKNPLCPTLFPA